MTKKNKRKIIWITMAVILLPFVSFWVWLQYQVRQSYEAKIPVSANAIIKVDVYAIYRSMLAELFNKRKGDRAERFKGIDLPANLFFYTLNGKKATTVFSSLPIKDISAFEQSLKGWESIRPIPSLRKGTRIFSNAEGTLTILYNDKTVAFAYSEEKEQVLDELTAILENSHMVAIKESKFKGIEKQTGHLTFLAGDKTGQLDFNKGNLSVTIHLPFNYLNVPSEIRHQVMPQESTVQMWLYADLKPLLSDKQYSIGNVTISGDSLLRFNPEGMEWMIGPSVVQKDSVVTYEYNDDFEKVAVVSVKEHHVPGISASLKTDAGALSDYLERQGIVLADGGQSNKEVFPLYQLYVTRTNDFLNISTLKGTKLTAHNIGSPYFLNLDVNFERLLQQQEFAMLRKYIGEYKQLKATGRKEGNNILIEGTLYFKNSKESALLQLMKAYL